jgi:hypothetical protein
MARKRQRSRSPPASPAPTCSTTSSTPPPSPGAIQSARYAASFRISTTVPHDVVFQRFQRNCAFYAMCNIPCPRCSRSFYRLTLVNDEELILSGLCPRARRRFYRLVATPLTDFNITKPKTLEAKKKLAAKRAENKKKAAQRKFWF